MKIKITILALILLVSMFAGIYFSDLLGFWKTESSKDVGTIKQGESTGLGNPKDIKGSFSFSDINRNFDIPVNILEKAFQIKNVADINSFKCKDLETYYSESISQEIGTNSVRMFVALYKGIQFEITEETYLPSAAIEILKDNKNLSKDQLEYIEQHKVIIADK